MSNFWIVALLICLSNSTFASTEATGLAQVELGQSYPQNRLTSYFSPGNAYRLRLFGGAKAKLGL